MIHKKKEGSVLRIIDGHAHLYPDEAAQKVIDRFTDYHRMEPLSGLGKGTISDLQTKMTESGTSYTVIANFAPLKSLSRTNEWTLAICKEHTNLIPLVSIYPDMPLEEVSEYFEKGAMGIKMHNGIQEFEPDSKGLEKIYRYCNENRIPITFHCGETSRVHMNEYTDMSHIIPVVKAFPQIPFVLTHLAASEPSVIEKIAESCPNALFDTSIAFSGEHCIHRIHHELWEDDEKAAAFFRRVGCDRFAFGSDYPFGNPVSDIKRIKQLPLTVQEKAMILGDNTALLYFETE